MGGENFLHENSAVATGGNIGGALSAVRARCNYLGVWPYWRPML